VTQNRATPNGETTKAFHQKVLSESYYGLLGVHPSASVRDIRQAYRDLSKLYHPDTTTLPTPIATRKFHHLNEAYATLSNPERRTAYDRQIGYSAVAVIRPLPTLQQSTARSSAVSSSSAYLDASDRPLSPGEVFALFILAITFVGCLVLAIAIGFTRSESLSPVMIQPTSSPPAGMAVPPVVTAIDVALLEAAALPVQVPPSPPTS